MARESIWKYYHCHWYGHNIDRRIDKLQDARKQLVDIYNKREGECSGNRSEYGYGIQTVMLSKSE